MDSNLKRSSEWLTIISACFGIAVAAAQLWPTVASAITPGVSYTLPQIELPAIPLGDLPTYVRVPLALFLAFAVSWPLSFVSVWLAKSARPGGHALAALIAFAAAVLVCSTIFSVGYDSAVPSAAANGFALWCFVGFTVFNACAADHYFKLPEHPRAHASLNTFGFSAIFFFLAHGGIVALYTARLADIETQKASVAIEQDRAQFLGCPAKNATEIRATYPTIAAAALYCWYWKAPASAASYGLDGGPGIIAYRALIVTANGELPLIADDCAATIDADFFIAGYQTGRGVAVLPNADYVIVACRTYASGARQSTAIDRSASTTTWQVALKTASQEFKATIRCKCKDLEIDRGSFDPTTRQLLLGTSTDANAVELNGDQVNTPGAQQRLVIALDQAFSLRKVDVFAE